MDRGRWLWKKKTSEKENEEEKTLQQKLVCLLSECNAKDELVSSHSIAAEEAMTDWEKAEVDAKLRKKKLDEALEKKVAERERVYADLQDSVRQFLSFAKGEEDKRVNEAVMKATKELEDKHKNLEEKYVETSRMVTTLTFENSQITTALQVKEKLIDDTNEQMAKVIGEFNELMARVDVSEKEYGFMKSEYQKLEKELQVRNEEIDLNRQSADASEKNDLENVKKIKKLETECRRLRVLRNSSEQRFGRLQLELESIKESKGLLEDKIENLKSKNKDLNKQLNFSRDQSNKLLKTIASLEAELEDKSHRYEQLETTCLRLLHQLESVSSKELIEGDEEKNENSSHAAREITELEESQETIETPSKNRAVLEKVLSAASDTTLSQRSSLRECLAEDGFEVGDPSSSPKTKEIISTRNNATVPAAPTLAIVASKKRGGGFNLLRRIFFMRKKGGGKKKPRHRSFTWQI